MLMSDLGPSLQKYNSILHEQHLFGRKAERWMNAEGAWIQLKCVSVN